jgi:hypothetical protein
MEIVFWELTWRIQASITGRFEETCLLQSILEAGYDQAAQCNSNVLGFTSEASQIQYRKNIEDRD